MEQIKICDLQVGQELMVKLSPQRFAGPVATKIEAILHHKNVHYFFAHYTVTAVDEQTIYMVPNDRQWFSPITIDRQYGHISMNGFHRYDFYTYDYHMCIKTKQWLTIMVDVMEIAGQLAQRLNNHERVPEETFHNDGHTGLKKYLDMLLKSNKNVQDQICLDAINDKNVIQTIPKNLSHLTSGWVGVTYDTE